MGDVFSSFDVVLRAFLLTIELFVVSAVLSLLFGTILAACRVGPVWILARAGAAYVAVVRNTPLLVVFIFVIVALPRLEMNIQSFFAKACLALTVYTSAFVCEAVRSGINAVSAGQAEAARALGLTFGQSLREVVLPQAFRTVVPPLGNVLIAMVKNTSIAAGFSVSDLSSLLPRLVNADAGDLTLVLVGVVVGYMVITLPSALAVNRIERRVAILR